MKNNNEYIGVFDYKESDTFRPTIEKRIHKDYPYGKTIVTSGNSFAVILKSSGGGYDLMSEEKNIKEKHCYNCKYFYYDTFCSFNNPCCQKQNRSLYFELEGDKNYSCGYYEEKQEIDTSNLRIRKLTPKECFRLMGLKDEDIDLVMQNQTDSSGWHLAGDSIVTTCLMAIFSQLLDIDWQEKFIQKEWWKNDK